MTDLALIVAMAVITFASRAVGLMLRANTGTGSRSRLLAAYPLSLFASLAAIGLLAPAGDLTATPAIAAGVGAAAGAVVGRASILAVIGFGALGYALARVLLG